MRIYTVIKLIVNLHKF